MKIAIITYDLQDTTALDNSIVKTKLLEFTNTAHELSGLDTESLLPKWITLKMPDTTILAVVEDDDTTDALSKEVKRIIESVKAVPGKIFIAFIDPEENYLWNAGDL